MKVLYLSKYYSNYLDNFYLVNKLNGSQSYQDMYDQIINDRYFFSDYYKQELPMYGYEVEQLIIDAKQLQSKWADENAVLYNEENWYLNIIVEQIRYYTPDILFIQDWSRELGSEFIQLIREQCPSIKLFIGYCGEAHPAPEYFKDHDIVISCARDVVEYYRKAGLSAHHVYHAFSPGINTQLNHQFEKVNDLGFIGRISPASSFHRDRANFLSQLARELPFTIHGEIKNVDELQRYRQIKTILLNQAFKFGEYIFDYEKFYRGRYIKKYLEYKKVLTLQKDIEYLRNLQGNQYFGIKMFDVVRQYKMLLNYHTSPVYASNLRMFEVTGMGSCLITDWKENINELFEPDKEVVTYRSIEEAKEKIIYLQNNPGQIQAISEAGKKRTLREHTYAHRAGDLHRIFAEYFTNRYKKIH